MFTAFQTDQNKCWAEVGRDANSYTIPCGKPIVSDVGLCAAHYEEITGAEWRQES